MLLCCHVSVKTKLQQFFISHWVVHRPHSANLQEILAAVAAFHCMKGALLFTVEDMYNNTSTESERLYLHTLVTV